MDPTGETDCLPNGGINMFLRNCRYVAALDHELIDGRSLSRMLPGEHVLLYRGDSGEVFAIRHMRRSHIFDAPSESSSRRNGPAQRIDRAVRE